VLARLTCREEVRRSKGATAAQSRGDCCLRCVLAEDRRESFVRSCLSAKAAGTDIVLLHFEVSVVADGGVCAVQPGEVVR
jgi:hypothetical protein